ncbi:MAG: sulfurtransferase TusA family protein, partial [Pseudomonadota bacterium]
MKDQFSGQPPRSVERFLDARGYRCPIPVLKVEAALRSMAPGDSLRVIADDPLAAVDIPFFCGENGHRAERLADELRSYPGVKDIDDGFAAGKPQLDYELREEARTLGLTVDDLA